MSICAPLFHRIVSAGRNRPPADEKAATFMALSNLTAESSITKRGPDCTVCLALTELPADAADLIRTALGNKQWRYTEIAAEVASDPDVPEWVRNIHHQTYRRHATGQCAAREKLR